MPAVPEDLRNRLRQFGQEQLLLHWEHLPQDVLIRFVSELKALDLELLRQLYKRRDRSFAAPDPSSVRPIPVIRAAQATAATKRLGEDALRRGEVALLLVAGGQASRLGFEQPKGMYPIGPVSGKSLFQIHADKTVALGRRYGKPVPLLVMTSQATDLETKNFFGRHQNFGLAPAEVLFFRQGTMPALDMATGRVLLEEPGRLFASPDGHGGTLTALANSGLLDRIRERGIRQLFYFQVDNPLVRVADPLFLGHHLAADAEVSSKVVVKESARDKLGNLVLVDGRCTIIEYSDLPDDLARQTDERGYLRIWAGSPAIHLFSLDFLERMTRSAEHVPFHVARKKVPYWEPGRGRVAPNEENALKFEKFIFDVLPKADRWTVVETSRREEFAPVKNATGPDSPGTVRQPMSNLAAEWLERAGVAVPRTAAGEASVPIEISPLYALDPEELAEKVDRKLRIDGPVYLQ